MKDIKQNSPDTTCVRCGAEATWQFADTEEQIVEIVCPDCGRFQAPRAEFEEAEFDLAEAQERRE